MCSEEIREIIELGLELKRKYNSGEKRVELLKDLSFVILFEKPSTRTRVSFELAVVQLGGYPIILYSHELQLARGETVADTARVLSRYVDGIIARVRKHEFLVELARHSSVPVVNALSDREHPVQALGDLMTIRERFGRLEGLTLAFVGDGRSNVSSSLLLAAPMVGLNVRVAAPRPLWPSKEYVEFARRMCESFNCTIELTEDPKEGVRDANIVYTDVWVSMGFEEEGAWRRKVLQPYQVNRELLQLASKDHIFMHCLPAVRGEEVTDEVIDGSSSVVWEQAENRLHVQKGLLAYMYRNYDRAGKR